MTATDQMLADLRILREQAFAQAHPVLLDQLRSYTGRNAFVLQMVKKLEDWGGLTEGQAIACNRMLATAALYEDAKPDGYYQDEPQPDDYKKSVHIGVRAQRLRDVFVRVVFCKLIRQPVFPRGALYLVKLWTKEGNHLTWFTEGVHEPFPDYRLCDFTVKEHETFRGEQTTKVSRVTFK